MPKDPNKQRINADLTKKEYKAFRTEADARYMSDKKLAEVIIREYLEAKGLLEKKVKGTL